MNLIKWRNRNTALFLLCLRRSANSATDFSARSLPTDGTAAGVDEASSRFRARLFEDLAHRAHDPFRTVFPFHFFLLTPVPEVRLRGVRRAELSSPDNSVSSLFHINTFEHFIRRRDNLLLAHDEVDVLHTCTETRIANEEQKLFIFPKRVEDTTAVVAARIADDAIARLKLRLRIYWIEFFHTAETDKCPSATLCHLIPLLYKPTTQCDELDKDGEQRLLTMCTTHCESRIRRSVPRRRAPGPPGRIFLHRFRRRQFDLPLRHNTTPSCDGAGFVVAALEVGKEETRVVPVDLGDHTGKRVIAEAELLSVRVPLMEPFLVAGVNPRHPRGCWFRGLTACHKGKSEDENCGDGFRHDTSPTPSFVTQYGSITIVHLFSGT
jgi:hypothetical protein